MARAIVTARVTQEQYTRINQLVSDGIFSSRSAVIQTFVELGLEHCNLGEDAEAIREVSVEYRARALTITQDKAIRSLANFMVEELSWHIEMDRYRDTLHSLELIKSFKIQLSSDMYQQLMEILEAEPVYQVALRMARGE